MKRVLVCDSNASTAYDFAVVALMLSNCISNLVNRNCLVMRSKCIFLFKHRSNDNRSIILVSSTLDSLWNPDLSLNVRIMRKSNLIGDCSGNYTPSNSFQFPKAITNQGMGWNYDESGCNKINRRTLGTSIKF